jgi:hypothetical protein
MKSIKRGGSGNRTASFAYDKEKDEGLKIWTFGIGFCLFI